MSDAIAFGMNARLFPSHWRPAVEDVAFAAQAGFQWLQFNDRAAGLDAAGIGGSFAAVAAALHANSVGAVLEIMPRVDPATGRTADGRTPLDMLEANLAAITTLPCARVHWHITFLNGRAVDPDRIADWFVPQLVAAVACAAREGFRFGIEQNDAPSPALSRPAEFAALLDAVPDLGFVWDINHAAPSQYGGFLALAPRMTMLHLSDTRLPAVNEHRPVGHGNVDFATILRQVVAGGFRGPAILEIGGLLKSGGYGQDTDAALVDSLARLRSVFLTPVPPARGYPVPRREGERTLVKPERSE